MEQASMISKAPHHVMVEDRKRVMMNGAVEVDSFDENKVVAVTELGILVVKGSQLHMQKLNVESGDIAVEGRIDSIEYVQTDPHRNGGSFLGKMFR